MSSVAPTGDNIALRGARLLPSPRLGCHNQSAAQVDRSFSWFAEGDWVQSFPKFGVERRGAPVEAFLRIAKQKILIRSEVTHPDFVVVLDPSLIEVTDFTAGLKENGSILVSNGYRRKSNKTIMLMVYVDERFHNMDTSHRRYLWRYTTMAPFL